MENPFKYGGAVRRPYFADRKSELKELKREVLNQNMFFWCLPEGMAKPVC